MEPDYAHLGRVVLAWRALRGMSQTDVAAAGGPSDTTLGNIEAGKWSSRAPRDTLRKLEIGFGWPEGTARRVLYEGFDPVESWPAGRRISATPVEFGPDADLMVVLEDRIAYRRELLDSLERQRSEVEYQIRSVKIEIDYLLRQRAELVHVSGKSPDFFFTDDQAVQHAVEAKHTGSSDPGAERVSEGEFPKAARTSPSEGRGRRKRQDDDAQRSQDIETSYGSQIIDLDTPPRPRADNSRSRRDATD